MRKTLRRGLLESLNYLGRNDCAIVERALLRAMEWHAGQLRESGESYVTHPIAAAEYLAALEADRDTLVATLLHDVVEDSRANVKDIEDEFGTTVAKLVEGVTKLTKLRYEGKRSERQIASLRKFLLASTNDLRVILIKLADRWHNIETIRSLRLDKQQRVAAETLEIYVPFARIFGLWSLKERFETVCFPIACPQESAQWRAEISKVREFLGPERESFVSRINRETSSDVTAFLIPMTDYQLYVDLHGDLGRLDETHNIDSVLAVIEHRKATAIDCYRVLGEIHVRYPVRSNSFRDYINAPKANGYQALHTTIFLSRRHELALRIQNKKMFEHANYRKVSSWLLSKGNDMYSALSSLHRPAYDQDRYLSDLHNTVLAERINVFTTSGEVISLPRESTGIDFAFALHPDDISSLSGIEVNGEFYEATRVLQDGDTIELVLNGGRPDMRPLWVEKAKSVALRETLKESIRQEPREQRKSQGIALLDFECRKRKLPRWCLYHLNSVQRELTKTFKQSSFDALLENVGTGIVSASLVAQEYKEILARSTTWFQKLLKFFQLLPRSRVLNAESPIIDLEITVQDRPGMIYDLAKAIAERHFNIARFEAFAVPPRDALYRIRLEVPNFAAFSDLYDALLQIPNVKTIIRSR